MKLNRTGLALFIILSIGFILRIYHLNAESFWLDECVSVNTANLNPVAIITQHYNSFHPPLYYLVLHFWIKLAGGAEASTRFFSVIVSLGSIFMVYRLGRLLFSKEAGLLSALIVSISTYHIMYSQETRMYGLVVLLALFSMYFFIRLQKKRSPGTIVCYLAATFPMLLTHYSALLVLLVQNIYMFTVWTLRKTDEKGISIKSWALLQGSFLVLCLPFIGMWLGRLARIEGSPFWLHKPTIHAVMTTFKAYAGSYILLPVFLLLAVVSLAGGMNLLVLVWLIVPQVMVIVLSIFSVPLYSTKYMLIMSIPLYLLAADGLVRIRYRVLKAAIIAVIVIFSAVSLSGYYSNVRKPQWRDAVRFIEEHVKPGDVLVFNDRLSKSVIFDKYYFKKKSVVEMLYPGASIKAPYILPTVEDTEYLLKSVKRYNRIWIVLSHTKDADGMIPRIFKREYRLLRQMRYNVIFVYLFEKK